MLPYVWSTTTPVVCRLEQWNVLDKKHDWLVVHYPLSIPIILRGFQGHRPRRNEIQGGWGPSI